VEVLNPVRSMARHPLFQTMLTWNDTDQPSPSGVSGQTPELELSAQPLPTGIAKFDLLFRMRERREEGATTGGISGVLEFSTALFDGETAEALTERLIRLLEAVVADPDVAVGRVDVLSRVERDLVLTTWSDTARDVSGASLPGLFEAQVARTPDAPAVYEGECVLSYAELNV
ncbi:condensation domain-containing protein, partial [Streptomyces olivaceus]|uniref:condensation domain-containing protein n=1 Tax=Streptomyces olivaceus TaxID=47716 RepID=UPI004056431A